MAFEASIQEVIDGLQLNDQITLGVIKPHYNPPFWKIPGGMVRPGESFAEAAIFELEEETGAVADSNQLFLLFEGERRQFPPHSGTFPVRMYTAFGCNFSSVHDPFFGETGDEGEVMCRIRFGDIREGNVWPIPTIPSQKESFFPPHLEMLEKAKKILVRR